MNTTTTVMVKIVIEGMHNFPKAAELFPEVAFLADRHRHLFHFIASKKVNHDDRDVEFIIFKRNITRYLASKYWDVNTRVHEFGSQSCEMLAREILEEFECEWVECWEDMENGARVESTLYMRGI